MDPSFAWGLALPRHTYVGNSFVSGTIHCILHMYGLVAREILLRMRQINDNLLLVWRTRNQHGSYTHIASPPRARIKIENFVPRSNNTVVSSGHGFLPRTLLEEQVVSPQGRTAICPSHWPTRYFPSSKLNHRYLNMLGKVLYTRFRPKDGPEDGSADRFSENGKSITSRRALLLDAQATLSATATSTPRDTTQIEESLQSPSTQGPSVANNQSSVYDIIKPNTSFAQRPKSNRYIQF